MPNKRYLVDSVPLSQPLGAGQRDTHPERRDTAWDSGGTPTLKELAARVLRRDTVRDSGGTAQQKTVPKGGAVSRPFGTKSTTYEQALNPDQIARLPLEEFEQMEIALRIESTEYGTLWLISNESCRSLADTGEPTYTAREARFVLKLSEHERQVTHGFKKEFGGQVQPRNQQTEGND